MPCSILSMTLTMLLLLHGLLPSVEGTTSSLCDSSCDDEDSPVCGTNGVTYRNFCFYMNAACNNKTLSLAATDACPGYVAEVTNRPRLAGTTSSSSSIYSCSNTCNKDVSPVCASDGQTYTNPCVFNAARCHADGNLWVLDYKPCLQIITSRKTCGGKRCTGSQQCMMELESEIKFCADTCTGMNCAKDKMCALRRSTCDSKRCPPQAVCT